MKKQQVTDEAIKYCSQLDFTDDKNLNEKGRQKIREWSKQDFIAGANYVLGQLGLSSVSSSAIADLNHVSINSAMNIMGLTDNEPKVMEECSKIINTIRDFSKHYG